MTNHTAVPAAAPQTEGSQTADGAEIDVAIEDNYGDEIEEVFPVKYSVLSYGADYPVDGLVKRIRRNDIVVPDFQRGYVWKLPQASRFIESLLLGLPVPGIFLSKEEDTQKLLVIDGQQRLRTLEYFYKGVISDRKQAFALSGLKSPLDGLTYDSLGEEDRRRLDDSIIHATIVHQEQPSDDDSRIYLIFERLNTGGLQLAPQEIRACVYHGPFNDLVRRLNSNRDWRATFGRVSDRMRDQELILRFLALHFEHGGYTRPMKEFLNQFMGKNRAFNIRTEEELSGAFESAIAVVHQHLDKTVFRPAHALNAAVFDAVMVGLAKRLDRGPITDGGALQEEYEALLEDAEFGNATSAGTTQEANVKTRITLAIKAFQAVP